MKKLLILVICLGALAGTFAAPVRRPVDVISALTQEARRAQAAAGIWGYADFFAAVGGVTFEEPFSPTDWVVLGTIINTFITSGATDEERSQNAIMGLTAAANLTLYKNLLAQNGGDPGRIYRPSE
jgi:hypothetical protein